MTMLSINTNVGALQAASASYSVNKSMETSMQRLSTGLRINSAADDAAGHQIANRMTAEIMGLKQAIKNAADAQALMGTAEGAIEEIQVMLLRMRELAVQAASDTVGPRERKFLNLEFETHLTYDFLVKLHSLKYFFRLFFGTIFYGFIF